jgi:hypothetical protein
MARPAQFRAPTCTRKPVNNSGSSVLSAPDLQHAPQGRYFEYSHDLSYPCTLAPCDVLRAKRDLPLQIKEKGSDASLRPSFACQKLEKETRPHTPANAQRQPEATYKRKDPQPTDKTPKMHRHRSWLEQTLNPEPWSQDPQSRPPTTD